VFSHQKGFAVPDRRGRARSPYLLSCTALTTNEGRSLAHERAGLLKGGTMDKPCSRYGAVDANFDKGVLYLTIKKPAKAIKTTKTIDIKTGITQRKAA
jgi:hypothetical protein